MRRLTFPLQVYEAACWDESSVCYLTTSDVTPERELSLGSIGRTEPECKLYYYEKSRLTCFARIVETLPEICLVRSRQKVPPDDSSDVSGGGSGPIGHSLSLRGLGALEACRGPRRTLEEQTDPREALYNAHKDPKALQE